MNLETSEGARADITEAQLEKLLERPAPLTALRGAGVSLVAIHADGPRYRLLHWDGCTWHRTAPEVYEDRLHARFLAFLGGERSWYDGLEWEMILPRDGEGLPAGLHVLVTFLLSLGGFAAGVLAGVLLGRHYAPQSAVLSFVLSALFAPPLAILGQYTARRIPSACRVCGAVVMAIHAGRFTYLCPRCGDIHITRWGIHRGPMSP